MLAGENFWEAVQQPFKKHDLTRDQVRALVDRGLQRTRGSYRATLRLFRLPPSDYKRFLAFLSQHDCNLSFQRYRSGEYPLPDEAAAGVSADAPAIT
jgi:hypothetical protein